MSYLSLQRNNNNNDQYVHRENASAFKYAVEMKLRGELLLSVCSSFRIDFYQRQFLVIIAFVGVVILSSLLLIRCLYRDGGLKDKLLGPY